MDLEFNEANFIFLYEDRLIKLGLQGIDQDFKELLSSGLEKFDLPKWEVDVNLPLKPEQEVPDTRKMHITVQNFTRGKGDDDKTVFYLNGPVLGEIFDPKGESEMKVSFEVRNQRPLSPESMLEAMNGNTPYLRVGGKNVNKKNPPEIWYLVSGEINEQGYNIAKTYPANFEALRAEFDKIQLDKVSPKQRDKMFEGIVQGHEFETKVKDNKGNVHDLYISASRSNNVVMRNENGEIITLNQSQGRKVGSQAEQKEEGQQQGNGQTVENKEKQAEAKAKELAENMAKKENKDKKQGHRVS